MGALNSIPALIGVRPDELVLVIGVSDMGNTGRTGLPELEHHLQAPAPHFVEFSQKDL